MPVSVFPGSRCTLLDVWKRLCSSPAIKTGCCCRSINSHRLSMPGMEHQQQRCFPSATTCQRVWVKAKGLHVGDARDVLPASLPVLQLNKDMFDGALL